MWKPSKTAESGREDNSKSLEIWRSVDDVISALIASKTKPRIDLASPKWKHWRYEEGPFARFRLATDAMKKHVIESEYNRQVRAGTAEYYATILWQLEENIVQVLDRSYPLWIRTPRGSVQFKPYHERLDYNHPDRYMQPSYFTREPEYSEWPKDRHGNKVWHSPYDHVDILNRRTFEKHIENLERALQSARHLRGMAEQRKKEVGASEAAKPNFAKRRFVTMLAMIWEDLTDSIASSAPDSKFAEFVSASWDSLFLDAPEQSFDRSIRDAISELKQTKQRDNARSS